MGNVKIVLTESDSVDIDLIIIPCLKKTSHLYNLL